MPVSHSRTRLTGNDSRAALAAILAAAAAAALLALRLKAARAAPPPSELPAPRPHASLHKQANAPDHQADVRLKLARWPRRLRAFCLVVLPPATVTAAISAPIPYGGLTMRLLIVAGVQLVLAGLLRQTDSGRARWATIILGSYLALLWLGTALVLLGQLTTSVIFFQDQNSIDPVTVLVLVVVGILVLCIPAVVLVAQEEIRPAIQPVLFAAVAVIIGMLCLPAMSNLTRTVGSIADSGSVTLYASGGSTQFSLIDQSILPELGTVQYGGVTLEDIEISDNDRNAFRWALLLRGGARLTNVSPDNDTHVVNLVEPGDSSGEQTQLISGETTDGFAAVFGSAMSTFTSDTMSRRTVVLPTVGGGSVSLGDQSSADNAVLDALDGPSTSPKVTVFVDVGSVEPQDTVASVSPALSDPGSLRWQGIGFLNPSFTLNDSDRADTTQNVLFTIAVLLGVSGSALLMAVQSALSSLGSRSAVGNSRDNSSNE